MITGNESANFVLACIVAILLGFLFIFIVSIRQYLFTNRRDLYPIKYYKNAKRKTKGESQGAADIVPAEPDPYAEIINDYPTLFTQDGVKDMAYTWKR